MSVASIKKLEKEFTRLANGQMHRERLEDKVTPLLDWAEYIKKTRATDEAAWQTVFQGASGSPLAHAASNGRSHWLTASKAGIHEVASLIWHLTIYSGEYDRQNNLPVPHRFPARLRFVGDRVTAIPLAWVEAFDGYYGHHYLGILPIVRFTRGGAYAQGLWSVFGFVLWDAPRVRALKTASVMSCFKIGWLS